MFRIVGRKVNIKDYLRTIVDMKWNPQFITLHNTAAPSLAQRPNGFTEQHMRNLQGYYSGKGWPGGPHFFVDQNGIWAFNPIELPGVHSPSWNKKAIGVEMLGDYSYESFNSGDGAKVRDNTVLLIAELSKHFSFDPKTMKLHKEDKKTTHDCPGKNVSKDEFIKLVEKELNQETKIVIYRKGEGHDPAGITSGLYKDGVNYGMVKNVEAITGTSCGKTGLQPIRVILGNKYTYSWDAPNMKLYCVEK